MKRISLLLLVMTCCLELSAGRVGRYPSFQKDTALKLQKLSQKSEKELQATQRSLKAQLKKVMLEVEGDLGMYSLEECIKKNRAKGLFASLLRDHLRHIEIVLAYKEQEHKKLERVKEGEKKD